MNTKITDELFTEVYKDYFPRLSAHARKILYSDSLVEECVQIVFSKLLQQDYSKIQNTDHLQRWLFTVCRNTSFKLKLKENRYVTAEENESLCEDPNPFENLDRKELYKQVSNILNTLSPQQKKMVKLRYFSDLDYGQIAKKMKTTTGNVGFHLSTALKNVRKKLVKSI
jgi:RNA polymerase sigma-70 factor (ECF subfamily)